MCSFTEFAFEGIDDCDYMSNAYNWLYSDGQSQMNQRLQALEFYISAWSLNAKTCAVLSHFTIHAWHLAQLFPLDGGTDR